MTDCPYGEVRDALPDYLNDRLDTKRRREVESHLAGCAACREELSLLRALRVTVRRAPAVDAEAIAASIPPYRAPARRSWGSTGGRIAAAIVAIAIGGTSIVMLRDRTPAPPVETTRPMAVAPVPSADTTPQAPTPAVESPVAERATREPRSGSTTAVRELAVAGGSIADLSDGELSALVEGIESLDGVPSAEVDAPEPVSIPAQEGI